MKVGQRKIVPGERSPVKWTNNGQWIMKIYTDGAELPTVQKVSNAE